MKLRELFDKLTPGMLDTEVLVKIRISSHDSLLQGSHFVSIEQVDIQDDGSVTLVVNE